MRNYQGIFEALGLRGRDGVRLDANETAFLTRQIEHVRATTYNVLYADHLARGFLPTASDIPAWAEHIVEVIYDVAGRARVISNGADDSPRVDVVASEGTYKVLSLGAAYGWSLNDLRQALGTGVPLNDKKAMMARQVIDTAIDEMLATGALASVGQSFGMVGLYSSSAVPLVTSLATGASWVGGTAEEVLKDLDAMISAVDITTLQKFAVNQIILPPREYEIYNQRRYSTLNGDTVRKVFESNNPGVSVAKWHRGTNAGAGGTVNRIVAYPKNAMVLEAVVPQEFEQLPPQLRNYDTVVNCHARCGGVRFHQPKAVAYMDLDASQS